MCRIIPVSVLWLLWIARECISYFKCLLSGEWSDKQDDGSYFIETNAHIFEHILRYLRTGDFPVFYDRAKGHDFALYQALLEEAKYFAIERLEKWLCERKYLKIVEIHYLATETQDRGSSRKQTTSDPESRTFMVEVRFIEITASGNWSLWCNNGTPSTALTESMAKAVRIIVGAVLSKQGITKLIIWWLERRGPTQVVRCAERSCF